MGAIPMRLAHVYHCYAVNDWERIVSEHLDALVASNLDAEIETLCLGIVGEPAMRRAVVDLCEERIPVNVITEADTGWEQVTLEALRRRVGTFDAVLYAHTKGVTHPPWFDDAFGDAWRESMTVSLVDGWKHCVALLDEHEAVGCHWVCHTEPNEWDIELGVYLFGGNFWWARSDLIQRLAPPRADNRFDAELWFSHNGPVDIVDLTPGGPLLANFVRRLP